MQLLVQHFLVCWHISSLPCIFSSCGALSSKVGWPAILKPKRSLSWSLSREWLRTATPFRLRRVLEELLLGAKWPRVALRWLWLLLLQERKNRLFHVNADIWLIQIVWVPNSSANLWGLQQNWDDSRIHWMDDHPSLRLGLQQNDRSHDPNIAHVLAILIQDSKASLGPGFHCSSPILQFSHLSADDVHGLGRTINIHWVSQVLHLV